MAKYELKTKATPVDPAAFLDAVENPDRRADGKAICAMLERITGEPPKMWGPSIVGFGSYRYEGKASSGTMCRLGFSPRKAELVLYVVSQDPAQPAKLAKLGKHRTGVSCLYIKRLSDVDMDVLEDIARDSLAWMNAKYPD